MAILLFFLVVLIRIFLPLWTHLILLAILYIKLPKDDQDDPVKEIILQATDVDTGTVLVLKKET